MRLEEIRALCEAATPGPWSHRTGALAHASRILDPNGGILLMTSHHGRMRDDAEFVAAARTLMPLLLEVAAAAQTDFEMSECGAVHERLRRALRALEEADV